jgi:hypothetical protein
MIKQVYDHALHRGWLNLIDDILLLQLFKIMSLIQHYGIKFVSDLWQVGGFLLVLRFPPPI